MRLIKTLSIFLVGFFLLACNLPTAQSAGPEGTFTCMGIHNGMWAGVGQVTFNANGSLIFGNSTGNWEYNDSTHELTIRGNEYFASGLYYAEANILSLTLKPDAKLSHTETGELNCQPSVE